MPGRGTPEPWPSWRGDLGPGPFAAVILFISPDADRTALAAGLGAAFPGVTVIGCTTAGEISSEGYSKARSWPSRCRVQLCGRLPGIPDLAAWTGKS
jgi:hypothetical protein